MNSFHSTLGSAVCFATLVGPAPAQDLVVRIGHVGPLSGGYAAYGKDAENGVRMAIEDLNAKGMAIGGRPAHFELVSEDDAADPKQGTAVAQKLCDAKVNGIVGHLNSGTTIPAAAIYHRCGVPHITMGATNPKLTQAGYKTTFRMTPNDNTLGASIARHAAHALGVKTVAVIDDRTAYGQGVTEVFKKTALGLGLKIVEEQYTNDKASEFNAQLTAIKSKHPDAIFFGGLYSQAGPMLRQMEQLGLVDVKFLGGDGICNPDLGKLSGGAKVADNVLCTEGGRSIQRMASGTAWKARYDARFPGQYQTPSPYTYDATMVLVDAMARAGSADPRVYATKLFSADYEGVTGRIGFEPDGEMKNPPMTLYVYRDGKKTTLD
ncbi:branched-chain amino acid ABC transporter substrate-binding protein [Piscinibacter sp. XHJ-5]|uniref:branched-chain amino acid ABC transporter substrate-binding protein n=1 Tax=Piscinibacter sp. XHJ-5 TaxID=3037797 RepID=UPI0024528D7A|nr:branched-chain amino acid ABC transporter substrate-binding protein [Piscinibacter sp. XHJ-5]